MKRKTVEKQELVWSDAQNSLAQWYSSSLGQSIAERLELEISQQLGDVFGYQGLQIGNLVPGLNLLSGAGLQRQLILDAPGNGADIHANVVSLPIATGTMKAVVFFHTMDFCDQPHQALREADRVLTDDGQLIIIGFNPYSAFGARHMLSAWRKREPWNGRFYPRHRISDWLSVLDYQVLDSTAFFMRPPINSERLLRRLGRLEGLQRLSSAVGGLYVLRARKQTLPMTMIRQWRRQRTGSMAVGSFARTGHNANPRPRATVARIDSRPR